MSDLVESRPLSALDDPALYDQAIARRAMAFLIDLFVLATLGLLFGLIILLLGVVTFGLGWHLYAILGPALAILYVAFTVGSGNATWGMRAMGLTMRMGYGAPPGFVIGAAHATLFWVSGTFLAVLILLPPFLDRRRRMLHDMALNTVVIDAALARQAGL